MIIFSYDREDALVIVRAHAGRWVAGSAAVKEHGRQQIAVGRLFVEPQWRGQHVGRRIIAHVLEKWQDADIWLYAEPYIRAGEAPGLPQQVLERFYASFGFEPAGGATGRHAMVKYRQQSSRSFRV